MKWYAKFSGIAYLIIFITGFFANFAVLEGLVNDSNPTATIKHILDNHSLFGYGIFSFVVMLLFDLFLVWSLYKVTKKFSKALSYVASLFRLLHAVFFGVALVKLYTAYQITASIKTVKSSVNSIIKLLQEFDSLWNIGLLFFAIHLFILGYTAVKSVTIPRAIGYLLILAGFGYSIDCSAKLVLSSYSEHKELFEMTVLLTAVIGELSFLIWLLYYGFKKQS